MTLKKIDIPPPPICVFCNAPWTDEMVQVWANASFTSGDYGEITDVEIYIDVTCETCKRLVYRKHVQQDGNAWRSF